MAAQGGLCVTWSETPKTGFLATRLNYSVMLLKTGPSEQRPPVNNDHFWSFPKSGLCTPVFFTQLFWVSCQLLLHHLWCHDDIILLNMRASLEFRFSGQNKVNLIWYGYFRQDMPNKCLQDTRKQLLLSYSTIKSRNWILSIPQILAEVYGSWSTKATLWID